MANTLTRRVDCRTNKRELPGESVPALKAVFWETVEDQLRVAPIRSGDSVIIQLSGFEVTVQPRTFHLLQSPYDKADRMGSRLFAAGKLPNEPDSVTGKPKAELLRFERLFQYKKGGTAGNRHGRESSAARNTRPLAGNKGCVICEFQAFLMGCLFYVQARI